MTNASSQLRPAALATILTLVPALAGGCQQIGGIDDTRTGHLVRGTAAGVAGTASLELRYSGGTELLTVTGDGTFAFDIRLVDGEPYMVVLPGDEPCSLDGAAGVVDGPGPCYKQSPDQGGR